MRINEINNTTTITGSITLAFLLAPVFVFAAVDTDNDGLTDEQEAYYYTDPENPDTDGDGHADGLEVEIGYSPHMGDGVTMQDHDYDNDGLNDWLELQFGTDIGFGDTDRDGFGDYDEVMNGTSPTSGSLEKTLERRITVDLTNQQVYYYSDDIKIHTFPVSTGNPWTPTPVGEFEVQRKVDIKPYIGEDYYLPKVKWNLQFLPMYYLHTAYWHDNFGKRTESHGCVNMREADAKILYDYIDVGTTVEVIGNTPPNRYVVESEA